MIVVRAFRVTINDGKGVCNPVLLAFVDSTLVHQIAVKQHQGPLLHFQRSIHILCLLPSFDSCAGPTSESCAGPTSSPERRLQILELWLPIVTRDQSLSERLRQMRACSYAETSVLERGILKRIPERQSAGWVCEADASVLMRNDLATDAGEFGNDLTLRDARVAVV